MSEERRKMAWQLAQTMVARRDDIPMERVARVAWKVVDSFLENEGGVEAEKLTEPSEYDEIVYTGDCESCRLLSGNCRIMGKWVKELEEERDALEAARELDDMALVDSEDEIKRLSEDFDLLTKERDELQTERDKLKFHIERYSKLNDCYFGILKRIARISGFVLEDENPDSVERVPEWTSDLIKGIRAENEQITKERDGYYKRAYERGGKIDNLAVENGHLAVGIDKLESEVRKLKAENEKLKEFKKGALADIFALTSKVSLQKEDYADLKAKIEEFKKTEIGQVMQEKLSLEFKCQGLEADLNRAKDEFTAEVEKLKAENSRLHEELSHASIMEK
jgi:chromosome segregation ATPase